MAPADQDRVGDVEEPLDHADLVAHLRAAEDHDERRARDRSAASESTVTSCSSRKPATAGRSRRATPSVVACARCAAPNASFTYRSAEPRKRVGQSRVVLRLARLEPAVLENKHLACGEVCAPAARPRGRRPPAPGARASRSTRRAARETGAIENCGSGPLGRPRCETTHQPCARARAGTRASAARRGCALSSRDGTSVALTLERHVEVDPHQRAASVDLRSRIVFFGKPRARRSGSQPYASAGCEARTFSASSTSRHE